MARTAIPVTNVTREKTERPAQTAGTTEMKVEGHDGRVMLEIEATAACTVELVTPGNIDGAEVEDKKYVFTAAGQFAIVAGMSSYVYNQVDGSLWLNATNTSWKVRAYHS